MRSTGAAALDLAWVAAGRFDGYVEHGLQPWDVAAGIILVREAGGIVTDAQGGARMLDTGGIIVANPNIHKLLSSIVGAAAPSS